MRILWNHKKNFAINKNCEFWLNHKTPWILYFMSGLRHWAFLQEGGEKTINPSWFTIDFIYLSKIDLLQSTVYMPMFLIWVFLPGFLRWCAIEYGVNSSLFFLNIYTHTYIYIYIYMGLTLRIIIFLIFARNFQNFRFLVIICLILGVFNVFLIKLRYGAFKFSVLNWSLLYLSYYFYYFFFFQNFSY